MVLHRLASKDSVESVPMVTGVLFVDRDGTLIADRHYIKSADAVELLPSVAESLRKVNELLIPVVIVTNQSGIGRGLLTESEFHEVQQRLTQLLSARGATVSDSYFCPHAPDQSCSCRKPSAQLFEIGAAKYNVSLSTCAFIGDRWRDIAAGVSAGGLGVLVPSVDTPQDDIDRARAAATVQPTFAHAVNSAIDFFSLHLKATNREPTK